MNDMKVVAKKINCSCDYLTENALYEVIRVIGGMFIINTDNDDVEACCLFRSCPHISGDWTIIGNRAVAVPNA